MGEEEKGRGGGGGEGRGEKVIMTIYGDNKDDCGDGADDNM